MRILISVALWGPKYSKIFLEYSLASMLAPDNLPQLARSHEVVYHIMTTRRDGRRLRRHPALGLLGKYVRLEWDFVEDHGYRVLPGGSDKYPFLSILQNIAIEKSLCHDALIFNYADFAWANGSLTHAVAMLTDDVDAVLSFCLPVDTRRGTRALDSYRTSAEGGAYVVDVPPRVAADIAIRCLHREAELRFWDGSEFTITPTYLLWPVGDDGILIRAYHQTVLVLRVKRNDQAYRGGIPAGSLDGYFTTLLAERAAVRHTINSDDVMVFSLYDTAVDSRLTEWCGPVTRDEALRESLRSAVSEGQRKFALAAMEVRRAYDRPDEWPSVERQSLQVIEQFHATTVFDPQEYVRAQTQNLSLQQLAAHWRAASTLRGRVAALLVSYYHWLDAQIVSRRVVRLLKSVLGPARMHMLRGALNAFVYRLKSRKH
jgi:hypothetical protein